MDRFVAAASDEPHWWPLKTLVLRLFQTQRTEDLGDALRIAEVSVQCEGRQLDRRRNQAVEDPLSLVQEHVEPAFVGVLEGEQGRWPPRGGEVLPFVHDDAVEAVRRWTLGGKAASQAGSSRSNQALSSSSPRGAPHITGSS